MENPTLTFLTPTFIAGDRSLNGLVAHELAHSWSGNLVTNANWSDSWLNEGVTSYFENRIMEALYGTRRARQEGALSFAEMEQDWPSRADHPETALHLPDGVAGPDGGRGGVVYDKGAMFLRTVETIVGRRGSTPGCGSGSTTTPSSPRPARDPGRHAREPRRRRPRSTQRLMLDQWVYQPGLPANVARPDPAAFSTVDAAAQAYVQGGPIPTAAWGQWTTAERLRFMDKAPKERAPAQLAALDQALKLSGEGNDEVLFAWLQLALANRYEPAVPLAQQFLAESRPTQVRAAAVRNADEGRQLGPGHRAADLYPDPARLPRGDARQRRQGGAQEGLIHQRSTRATAPSAVTLSDHIAAIHASRCQRGRGSLNGSPRRRPCRETPSRTMRCNRGSAVS